MTTALCRILKKAKKILQTAQKNTIFSTMKEEKDKREKRKLIEKLHRQKLEKQETSQTIEK